MPTFSYGRQELSYQVTGGAWPLNINARSSSRKPLTFAYTHDAWLKFLLA